MATMMLTLSNGTKAAMVADNGPSLIRKNEIKIEGQRMNLSDTIRLYGF